MDAAVELTVQRALAHFQHPVLRLAHQRELVGGDEARQPVAGGIALSLTASGQPLDAR